MNDFDSFRFVLLLNHFEAASFGDPLFAAYVTLPLQQRLPLKYRGALWGEFSSSLLAMTFSLDQVRTLSKHLNFSSVVNESIMSLLNILPGYRSNGAILTTRRG